MISSWDEIAVALIVALAAGYLIRRLFARGGCGSCEGAGCPSLASNGLVQLEPPSEASRSHETELGGPPKQPGSGAPSSPRNG